MQAAVTLSEALRRNAKHEARLFKYLMVIAGAPLEMIRDSCFAQNDIRYNGNHELGCA